MGGCRLHYWVIVAKKGKVGNRNTASLYDKRMKYGTVHVFVVALLRGNVLPDLRLMATAFTVILCTVQSYPKGSRPKALAGTLAWVAYNATPKRA
jgi:hypothetical protein